MSLIFKGCLGRVSADLLNLVITFLKKISVFEENKEIIKRIHEEASAANADQSSHAKELVKPVAKTLSNFICCSSKPLILIALRMLFNLSFDKVLC